MITLYALSGSPFAWRAWLSLEHKALEYRVEMLSFSDGGLKKPEYLVVNPRGRVPTLVDGDFALWESAAIVEYLDEAYRGRGRSLFPEGARERATVRRMIREIDGEYGVRNEEIVHEVLFKPADAGNPDIIARARKHLLAEIARWDAILERREFLAGELGAADYSLYPLVALTRRLEKRYPALDFVEHLPAHFKRWMTAIESLPAYDKTYPPHWRG